MSTLSEERAAKDALFRDDPHSPLSHEQRHHFQGLRYYPENPDLRFLGMLERYPDPPRVTLTTSTGQAQEFLQVGQFPFQIEGQALTLQFYASPHHSHSYFVPFADATSGHETYGAGRYLDIEEGPGGRISLDFNLAYNPYCAYNEQWSCPIPPAANRLPVPIRAGEMNFH